MVSRILSAFSLPLTKYVSGISRSDLSMGITLNSLNYVRVSLSKIPALYHW